jgi:hypothetical protein
MSFDVTYLPRNIGDQVMNVSVDICQAISTSIASVIFVRGLRFPAWLRWPAERFAELTSCRLGEPCPARIALESSLWAGMSMHGQGCQCAALSSVGLGLGLASAPAQAAAMSAGPRAQSGMDAALWVFGASLLAAALCAALLPARTLADH